MENTENNPKSADALLSAARDAAGLIASLTGSEAVSAHIGAATLNNNFIQASVGEPQPLSFAAYEAVRSAWAESNFSDVYLIDTRYDSTLELDEIVDILNRTCQTTKTEIDGHQVYITTFPYSINGTDIDRNAFEYEEIDDLETRLHEHLQNLDGDVPEIQTSTGWTRLVAFLEQITFQLETLAELCPNGVTETESDDDDYEEYGDEEEEWDEDASDPWEDESVVGWGEDVEWRFGGDPDEIAALTDDNALVDPKSEPGNIKWVTLTRGMKIGRAHV